MMKLFEKKIYIGSLVGFFTTIIIIIAVCFPSLFNLEKKKIPQLDIEIHNLSDADQFKSFLDSRKKDGKIFKLEVSICEPDNDDNRKIQQNYINLVEQFYGIPKPNNAALLYPIIIPKDNASSFISLFYFEEIKGKYLEKIENKQDIENIRDEISDFYDIYLFPKSEVDFYYAGVGHMIASPALGKRCASGIDINGYFIFNKSQMDKHSIYYLFESISKKEIALRNY